MSPLARRHGFAQSAVREALVFRLAMIFASFSLFSRAEPVVIVALFICSLSSACALLLIMEWTGYSRASWGLPAQHCRHALSPL
ncbi:MAG TPA: hypothetical protein VJL90_01200 [Pseudorhodoplanes sp.]|nr:hypothetical protein [Pseudorhodoplanes sp.]